MGSNGIEVLQITGLLFGSVTQAEGTGSGTRSRRVAPARPRCLCARSFWRKVATGEDLHHGISEMDLNPVAIELYLMEPPLPTRYTINGGRQRGLNNARVGRFRADGGGSLTLERHNRTRTKPISIRRVRNSFRLLKQCAGRGTNPLPPD